jgi:hypothetical protein
MRSSSRIHPVLERLCSDAKGGAPKGMDPWWLIRGEQREGEQEDRAQ